jgi:sarcosine oxidase
LNNQFDAIVIGVGSMGSAACFFLASRGYKVLGLEQFSSPHEQGSHGGQSRIIRKAYFEHPDYVPLLNRAYTNWTSLETITGEQVYFKTGILYCGPTDHPVMLGVEKAASLHQLQIEKLPGTHITKQFPAFASRNTNYAIYEPEAGILNPGKVISGYIREAISKNARIITQEKVLDWKKDKDGIRVTTTKSTYYTRRLVITAGAWASKMIEGLQAPLRVTRQFIAWFHPRQENSFHPDTFPCWMIADHKRPGVLYGFPYLRSYEFGEPAGVKIAWHHPGIETDPDNVNRAVSTHELNELKHMIGEYIPGLADAECVAMKTCLYTNTPDENFIIDHLPGYDNEVTIACGFCGHGFKFVSVVGEILADLAVKKATDLPIEFLGLNRFKNKTT